MTTRIPQPGGHGYNPPPYDALIAASKHEIARRKHGIAQLRRQRRRAKRAQAAHIVRTHSRTGILGIGTAAFASSMVCFALGEMTVATELLKFALSLWLLILGLPRR
ncbi:hypothetical protein ABZ383_14475 [Streptomyces sp. NPDC005900]|uniref:hypothetical protein n=1 Tax=Streptomyces sp. NPDC005900 TaxID=3154569 RepID=UPI0033C75A63